MLQFGAKMNEDSQISELIKRNILVLSIRDKMCQEVDVESL